MKRKKLIEAIEKALIVGVSFLSGQLLVAWIWGIK
jgi:hypothetical protein